MSQLASKNKEKSRERKETADQYIGQQVFRKGEAREAEREGRGCQSMSQLASF